MIGSPAWRGAVASLGGGAGRACLATAFPVSAVSAAIAASVTMAGELQRRIAADCAVVDRLNMRCSPEKACPRLRRSRVTSRFVGWHLSHIQQHIYEESWLALARECAERSGAVGY